MFVDRVIVSVEDSDIDFLSLTRALKSAGFRNPVRRCSDGPAAREALLSDAGCPKLEGVAMIILDLNLPGVHGCDLLTDFRKFDQTTPVLVFSTSDHVSDVSRCYKAGANAFLKKPLEFEHWEEMFRTTVRFWLQIAELPPPYNPE